MVFSAMNQTTKHNTKIDFKKTFDFFYFIETPKTFADHCNIDTVMQHIYEKVCMDLINYL